MRHVRVPSIEEFDHLEFEVQNEIIDGAESSFTTQKKVYQFLIDDYEAVNDSLLRELHLYRKNAAVHLLNMKDEIEAVRSDVSRVDEENKQLHELLVFFGNQLNGRLSTNTSSSSLSISKEDSSDTSRFLDSMISEMRLSAAKSIDENDSVFTVSGLSSADRPDCTNSPSADDPWDEDSRNLDLFWATLFPLFYHLCLDIHRTESGNARYPDYLGNEQELNTPPSMDESVIDYSITSLRNTESVCASTPSHVFTADDPDNKNDDDTFDEVVETLTEHILLKDKLLENMENEIDDQAECIKFLVKQVSMYSHDSMRDKSVQKNPRDRGLLSNGEIFPRTRPHNILGNELNQHQPLISFVSATMALHTETSSTPSSDAYNGVNIGKWEKHTKGFGSRYLRERNYGGKGLGKNQDGIINPVEVKQQLTLGLNEESNGRNRVENNTYEWPPDTTLIIGDSILLGVVEDKLKKYRAKVRPFRGARVDDIYDYVAPLLRKRPANIILHVGSNDAIDKDSKDIFCEILRLKDHIESQLPNTKVILSCPTLRLDNGKANRTLRDLDKKLNNLAKVSSYEIVPNGNVIGSMIGKKGLHLNQKGSDRLAKNFIARLQCL